MLAASLCRAARPRLGRRCLPRRARCSAWPIGCRHHRWRPGAAFAVAVDAAIPRMASGAAAVRDSSASRPLLVSALCYAAGLPASTACGFLTFFDNDGYPPFGGGSCPRAASLVWGPLGVIVAAGHAVRAACRSSLCRRQALRPRAACSGPSATHRVLRTALGVAVPDRLPAAARRSRLSGAAGALGARCWSACSPPARVASVPRAGTAAVTPGLSFHGAACLVWKVAIVEDHRVRRSQGCWRRTR
jgi:hypothetical protein